MLIACDSGEQTSTVEESEVPKVEVEKTLQRWEEEHQLEKTAYADSVNAGLTEDAFKGSARREAKGKVGDLAVTINYGSPGIRGRVIWNGLVSYDQVWVTGSHWATAITFSEPVMVGENEVPAGMHGFFSIPGREEWVLILNQNFDQHLAEKYDESLDFARFSLKPETLETPVQRLTYEVAAFSDKQGAIVMSWDKVKVQMPFTVKE